MRAQIAAAIGTLADLASFVALLRLEVAPVPAVIASASLGALVNFLLARHHVFDAADRPWARQAVLFALGAGISIALNAGLLALLLHLGAGAYLARLAAIVLVAGGFNFPFQKRVVFAQR